MASHTPSPADWPALEAANWPELLAHLGTSPLAEAQLGPEIAWVVTGIDDNTHNGVAWTQLDAAAAPPIIAAVLTRLRERALPFL